MWFLHRRSSRSAAPEERDQQHNGASSRDGLSGTPATPSPSGNMSPPAPPAPPPPNPFSIQISCTSFSGRKHRFGAVHINEDTTGSFEVTVMVPPAPGSKSKKNVGHVVTAWYIADGHGQRVTGQNLSKSTSSPGTAFIRLMERKLPAALRAVLDPLPVPLGDPQLARRLAGRFAGFRDTLNGLVNAADKSLCENNGSTLCLAFRLENHMFAYCIGDSSMCMINSQGKPLRVWRRLRLVTETKKGKHRDSCGPLSPGRARPEPQPQPQPQPAEDEYDDPEPAVCSCEDSLDGFPRRVREGQDPQRVARNFASLYPEKLHPVADAVDIRPPGSVNLPPTCDALTQIAQRFPRLRMWMRRSFLLVTPNSKYGLRMLNTLGNLSHFSSMINTVNFYYFPLPDLANIVYESLDPRPPNVPPVVHFFLVMVSDGVKDVLSTAAFGRFFSGEDFCAAFRPRSPDQTPEPPLSMQLSPRERFELVLQELVSHSGYQWDKAAESAKRNLMEAFDLYMANEEAKKAHLREQGAGQGDNTPAAVELAADKLSLPPQDPTAPDKPPPVQPMDYPAFYDPVSYSDSSSSGHQRFSEADNPYPFLDLVATAMASAAQFCDSADDVTALVTRIEVPLVRRPEPPLPAAAGAPAASPEGNEGEKERKPERAIVELRVPSVVDLAAFPTLEVREGSKSPMSVGAKSPVGCSSLLSPQKRKRSLCEVMVQATSTDRAEQQNLLPSPGQQGGSGKERRPPELEL